MSVHRSSFRRWILGLAVVAVLLAINGPVIISWASREIHDYEINTAGYKAKYGHWVTLKMAREYHINSIHSVLLHDGKILMIAGSGNDLRNFDHGVIKSEVYDPATNTFKLIPTPSDMFCGGQTYLPDGNVLIAGGTTRYEVLASAVKYAAGVMTIQDESPNGMPFTLPAGTRFQAPDGRLYESTMTATVKPATKIIAKDGQTTVTASTTETWVRALERGKAPTVSTETHLRILGQHRVAARNLFGLTNALNLDKQEFRGTNKSYIFNVAKERYERVSNLNIARWYPTLVGLSNGNVLAVSGLNQFGQIIEGQTEEFSPKTKKWTLTPKLTRILPTFPAVYLMADGNLFYSGSNAGYGSSTIGRTPGIWNLSNNNFEPIPLTEAPTETETSGSLLLPPAQAQRYMIIGGGGVGNSLATTARTEIVNLTAKKPHWTPGPSLPEPTRYPNAVITPNNEVVITNGSRYYRGEFASDILTAHLYNPATNTLTPLASPSIGRDYHTEAILLPDGRIFTVGGNPLYGNKTDTSPGYFQTNVEIYSPPYLYRATKPTIAGGPRQLMRGNSAVYLTSKASAISGARLIAPSTATHVTDVNQRSIELRVVRHGYSITVTIPRSVGLVPTGWYMLFITNRQNTPSDAYWVHIGNSDNPLANA